MSRELISSDLPLPNTPCTNSNGTVRLSSCRNWRTWSTTAHWDELSWKCESRRCLAAASTVGGKEGLKVTDVPAEISEVASGREGRVDRRGSSFISISIYHGREVGRVRFRTARQGDAMGLEMKHRQRKLWEPLQACGWWCIRATANGNSRADRT